MQKKSVLIVDINGTINRNKKGRPFIDSLEDIEIIPGTVEILSFFKQEGFLVLGCSNQGGVAFGYKTLDDVIQEMNITNNLCNGLIDYVMYCPFYEDGVQSNNKEEINEDSQYSFRSLTRKPNIGMLAIAEDKFFRNGIILDWNSSIFLGDMWDDQECAQRAQIFFVEIKDFHRQFFNVAPQELSLDKIYQFTTKKLLPK